MASHGKRNNAPPGDGNDRSQIVFFIIVAALVIIVVDGLVGLYFVRPFYVFFAATGIVSFLLSLVIMSGLTYYSILPGPNEGHNRKKSLILDRKEIRRSIAITFTILYILLISISIHKIESATPVISTVYSFVNETVINETANSSFSTITILNETTNLTGNGLTGEGLTHLSSLITAFTTLYAVIIAFYFGSRVYEKIKEIKDAEEVLKIQYIMNEINKDDFEKKMKVLRQEPKPNSQLEQESDEKKITIVHKGGIDIRKQKEE